MRTINTRRHSAGRERGAALIVAIGVLTLLIVIALTFFRASLGDMKTAQNTVDGVRAELLADGATAVAIGFLNHDRLIHPTYSSLDHAWRTYFNGAWAVGKPWMWAPLADPSLLTTDLNYIHRMSLLRGGVPEIDPLNIAGYPGLATNGAPTDGMYIPRVDYQLDPTYGLLPSVQPQNYRTFEPDGKDNDGDGSIDEADELTAFKNPFVNTGDLPQPGKFPPIEQIFNNLVGLGLDEYSADLTPSVLGSHVFDLHDNPDLKNGRIISLQSSPFDDPNDAHAPNNQTLPSEQIHFWTDVDNDGDGLNDSMWLPVGADRFFPDDGLDNDLDGKIDADDTDGEAGVFMYRGDTDNIVIFTVPQPFMERDPNGLVPINLTPYYSAMGICTAIAPPKCEEIDTVLFEGANGLSGRDNDYDLVVDQPMDASPYMLTDEAVQALRDGNATGTYPYYNLLLRVVGTNSVTQWQNAGALPHTTPVLTGTIRGETVTELAGRMAILITDESSKVNINAAGGWAYPVFPDLNNLPLDGPLLGIDPNPEIEPSTAGTPLQRSFADGVGPYEYDTRVLTDIGAPRARWMWQYLMGARQGIYSQNFTDSATYTLPYFDRNGDTVPDAFDVEGDATLPGYGYVDDNGNLLQLALDGINNHGGPNYRLNPLNAGEIDPSVDFGLSGGKWGGIDEPGEYQRFRPLRNLVAESNGNLDDDGDDLLNEIGEIGDQFYRTHQQLKLIDVGTVSGFFRGLNDDEEFENVRNLVTAHSTDRNDRHAHPDSVLADFTRTVGRQTTGLRKDLNVTRPQDVARAIVRDWSYPASVAQQWTVSGGALVAPISPPLDFGEAPGTPGRTVDFLAGLRQENVTVTTSQPIMGLPPQPVSVAFTMLADAELRAHQVAATIKDFADRDYTRSVDDEIFVNDLWWRDLAKPFIGTALDTAAKIARTQRIYYTTAGLEAIRINEVNVRPLRRFEAEAITDLSAANANVAVLRGLDPNRFVPHNGTFPAATQAAAEAIEEEGFRIRVTTTTEAIDAFNTRANRNLEVVITNTDPDADPVGERWNLRPLVAFDGTIAVDAGLLGLEAAWATYRQYLDVRDPDADDPDRTFQVPDVVQFSFQATVGLPAGNYYLKINTQYVDVNGNLLPSVGDEDDFLFAVKTGTFEQDWFTDVMNIESYAAGRRVYNEAWRSPALLGSDQLGGSAGMAFLQGDAVFRFTDPALGEPAPIGSPAPFTTTPTDFALNNILQPNLGFTIRVPDRTLPIPPLPDTIEDDQWLHIAIRSMRGDTVGFVVNFIEFSQEPDHEWVEVTNESDEAVDLSGWQLAVENHPLGLGPMTVPDGTTIAPKGMLLLGTNKFDYAFNVDLATGDPIIQNPYPPFRPVDTDPDIRPPRPTDDPINPPPDRGNGFFVNGIGLVSEDLAGPASGIFAGVTVPSILYFDLDPDQGSVFYRPGAAPLDFLDLDGSGLQDVSEGAVNIPDDSVTSSEDPVQLTLGTTSDKPWDRIVELIIPDLVAQTPQSQFAAADVGRIVLGGGIFPNRPEFDAWDNDGDNRVLGFDQIDNDGDGFIDEFVEGFDEGRFAREARLADGATPVPGSYNAEIAPYFTNFFDFDPVIAGTVPAYWDGGATDPNPPQWKEFLERRNFPGDIVIVTLYEGPAKNGQAADRVTYIQRDVENRQIDDVLMVNDFDMAPLAGPPFGDAGVNVTEDGVPVPLDDRFASFWPEDTMGIDFARSLERKHPAYTGDRFGVQNRFQATDGSYDDWSDSAGRWERSANSDFEATGISDRFNDPNPAVSAAFLHAVSGTPLRRNVAARYALNDRGAVFDLTEFQNHPLVSPGSALLAPHTSRTSVQATFAFIDLLTGVQENFLTDRASPNVSTGARSDLTYDAALIGQRFDDATSPINFFHDIRSFIGDVGTTDSVSLNAGQATVIQVTRPPTAGGEVDPNEPWPVGVLTGYPPQRWSPLMMFKLTGTTGVDDSATVQPYGYDRQYLFQPLASLPATVDNTRWPMPLRTALYASSNFNNVGLLSNTSIDGAQAVFVWDGDDGLENGEYDLYVVATEDLSLLSRAHFSLANPEDLLATPRRLLTDIPANVPPGEAGVGLPFVDAAGRTANREVYFDIEVFRDTNGDRKAWEPNLLPGDFLQDSQLHRGQVAGWPLESFGVIEGARPDADGVIHYGVVRVENNFLAVSLRNRSAAGFVARFSRVILAARNKTSGRININTVETKRIDIDNPLDPSHYRNFYNPLTGLPGILLRPTDDNAIGPMTTFTDRATGDFGLVSASNSTNEPLNEEAAQTLAQRIVSQRLRLLSDEQPDGRYYELTSDLLADAHFAAIAEDLDGDNVVDLRLRPPLVVERDNILDLPDLDQNGVVDFNAARAGAIAEAAYRFRRMQNLITTRGDVYEILVTVQAGYGTDANGDGRINWRDDSEFTATAEKTARTIYER